MRWSGLLLLLILLHATQSVAQIVQYSGAAITNTGWTTFTATAGTGTCGNSSSNYTGTCIVYVSSGTGNDSTCAAVIYSAGSFTPCATLAKAQTLMRTGKPDWLLAKKGDTFLPDGNGDNFTTWNISGASATQPMVIGSYDPSQPGVVDPPTAGARPLIENAHGTTPFATTGSTGGDYIAIVGLEFYNYTEDPNNGSYNPTWSGPTGISLGANTLDWALIEDCKVSFYGFNINVEPTNNSNPNAKTSAFIFNRNVVVDSYGVGSPTPPDSSGLYMGTAAGNSIVAATTLTGNVFDHNGWNATVANAGPTDRHHNIYSECVTSTVQPTNSTAIVEYNISTNDANASALRLPGTYTNNLFAFVPSGIQFGVSTGTASCDTPPAITTTYNVVIDTNWNSAISGGGGVGTTNLSSATINNNIISTYASTSTSGNYFFVSTPNVNNNFTSNTIWSWAAGVSDNGGGSGIPGSGDVTTPNNYNCTTCNSGGAYPDPYRSLGSYYATLPSPVSSASVTGTINNCSPSCAASTTAGNVMNVTAVASGTLNVGDAITFSGQTKAMVITGNSTIASNLCGGSACTGTGGTGTYAVNIAVGNCTGGTWSSCSSYGAVTNLITSQTLTGYSPQSLIALEHAQAKNNWNSAIDPCALNGYIQQGFGQAANCNN